MNNSKCMKSKEGRNSFRTPQNFSAMEKFLDEEGMDFAYHKSNDFVLDPEGLTRFVNKVIK
jgi:hypothetical protein